MFKIQILEFSSVYLILDIWFLIPQKFDFGK